MDEQQLKNTIMIQETELSIIKLKIEILKAIISTENEIRSELIAIITRLLVGVDEQWMTFPENKELMTKVHEYIDNKIGEKP